MISTLIISPQTIKKGGEALYLYQHKKNPSILMLHRLNRAHRNAVTALMAQYHLQDVGNPMLLFILSKGLEEGAVLPNQKQLAQWLHVSPATVANSLKSLERGGYVHKEQDPQDARRNRVSITEKGRQAVLECVKVFETVDNQMLQGFSQEDQAQLMRYQEQMLSNLFQLSEEDCPEDCPPFPPHHPHCHL